MRGVTSERSTYGWNPGASAIDLASRPDHGGDAVVRGAQHEALRFDGAHARDLKMLMTRAAVPEPRIVGHVHQRIRLASTASCELP